MHAEGYRERCAVPRHERARASHEYVAYVAGDIGGTISAS